MQFLNNDIDQLMRRAAEAYDPPVTGADWKAVAGRLGDGQQDKTAGRTIDGRRFFLLFFFLLTSLVCNRYLQLKWGAINTWHATATQSALLAAEDKQMQPSIQGYRKNAAVNSNKEKRVPAPNASNSFYLPKHRNAGTAEGSIDVIESNSIAAPDQNEIHRIPKSTASKKEIDLSTSLSGIRPKNLMNVYLAANERQDADKKRKGKFYIGMLAGVEGNSVRGDKAKHGWHAGIALGYRFSSRWALEGGVLWSRKFYYSEGAYFNTKHLSLPNHATIIHAEGNCQMFEIPLAVQYRLHQGKKGFWFAGAGASAYLMQLEDYDYLYERYGVQYSSSKYYKRSTQNWLGTVNISGGYQHRIGRLGYLRVAPYIKLPVNGMGIGQLPITSAGLQAGLVVPVQ